MEHECMDEILLSKDDIAKIIEKLGAQISNDYKNKNLLIVCVLKGSVVFTVDLMRALTIPCSLDFMAASSYHGVSNDGCGNVKILKDLSISIEDYDVLIVEDILESGYTLDCIVKMLEVRNPKSLKICTLLDKPQRHKIDIHADYVGCEIPSKFVVGYGLDYNEKYRQLPFVGVLKPCMYE